MTAGICDVGVGISSDSAWQQQTNERRFVTQIRSQTSVSNDNTDNSRIVTACDVTYYTLYRLY